MEQGFHFIRPLWLLLLPLGPLLLWWWQRRNDPLQRWKGMIAPHLLAHLVVGDSEHWRPRPIHLVCAVIVIGSIACAGPTWELESPPFAEDRAPMMVAMDLSPAMNAIDVSPTRLERAKQKVRDLMALRAGGRTGLIVYTNTAHMVLPPTDDAALMEMFLSALSTDLLPGKGVNAGAALALADRLLDAEGDPGTIVFFTSGFDEAQIPTFVAHHQHSRQQVLMLAVAPCARPMAACRLMRMEHPWWRSWTTALCSGWHRRRTFHWRASPRVTRTCSGYNAKRCTICRSSTTSRRCIGRSTATTCVIRWC